MKLCLIFLRVRPSRIWYLKFLLEGYEGLALVTTMDRQGGLVRLAVPGGRYGEALQLLDNLAAELS